jgi:hypothetical protein
MPPTTNHHQERAPLLLVFGPLADRVAGIIRERPSLTAGIIFAPREAIHAISAFLYLAPEAAGTVAEVADRIGLSDPRQLLKMALPNCPTRLYRALNTAGNSVRQQSFYARLDAVCCGPFGTALLAGTLNDERINFYLALQTMDPLIANLHTAIPETLYVVKAIDTLVAVIRSYGALSECDFNLPKNAGTGAVLRRLLRGLYAVRAPKPSFTVPPPFHVVATIGELREIGRRFKNCVAHADHLGTNYWFDLAAGSAVYLTSDEPPLLIALRRIGTDLWHIEQIAGPKGQSLPNDVQLFVESALKEIGLRLVSVSPTYALSNLVRAASRPRGRVDHWQDEDDELFDDLDLAGN